VQGGLEGSFGVEDGRAWEFRSQSSIICLKWSLQASKKEPERGERVEPVEELAAKGEERKRSERRDAYR
jgi:hypothetical protein